MVRSEETYPHSRPDKWKVTTSEQALIYVCERWNDGQEEAEYDIECLEKYTQLIESIASDLITQGKTKETSGPTDRNKLPLDQYTTLKKNGEMILGKIQGWLGYGEGCTIRNLCRRYLKLHGFFEQEKIKIPILDEGSTPDKPLSKAVKMTIDQRKEKCEAELQKAKDLETKMHTAVNNYTKEWLYIAPDTTGAPKEATPEAQPATAHQDITLGAHRLTPKAVPELKPKNILTQTTSRVELVTWIRQMKSYFAASYFNLCPPEIQIHYLEERMDQATFRMLRRLTGDKPHEFPMEKLYDYIRNSVVRTDSLQHRRVGLLEFKQRNGEIFSNALCRIEEAEADCDISKYDVDEFRLHIRLAGCTDLKLKEELLKQGDDTEKPLTVNNIFEFARAYEQRMMSLRTKTDEATISSMATTPKQNPGCKACTKPVKQSYKGGFFALCKEHYTNQNDDSLKCDYTGCANPKGDHNLNAHKNFGKGDKDYTSGITKQRPSRSQSKGSPASSRKSSKSPAKYSRQNSQNREVVAKSKDDATISAIGMDLMTDNSEYDIGDLGSASDSDFDFNPAEYDNFGCSTIVAADMPDTLSLIHISEPTRPY